MRGSGQVRRRERSGGENTVGVVEVEEAWGQVMDRMEGRLVKQRSLHCTAMHHWKAKQKEKKS